MGKRFEEAGRDTSVVFLLQTSCPVSRIPEWSNTPETRKSLPGQGLSILKRRLLTGYFSPFTGKDARALYTKGGRNISTPQELNPELRMNSRF
jgi:hypothetical protein